jgi:hypothetical protein
MVGAIRKQLTCPACGVIVADARYQPWLGRLVLTSVEGYELLPLRIGVLLRLVQQELASATSDRERTEAEDRLAFLERNMTELVFDLKCQNGHRILRSMPDIAHAMRHTHGAWVSLG